MHIPNPQKAIRELIAQTGQEVRWERGERVLRSKAVLFPIRSLNRAYWEQNCVPQGRLEDGYFQYIGSTEEDGPLLRPRDLVQWNGERFLVKSCEKMFWNRTPAYIWGILQRYSGEEVEEGKGEKIWGS